MMATIQSEYGREFMTVFRTTAFAATMAIGITGCGGITNPKLHNESAIEVHVAVATPKPASTPHEPVTNKFAAKVWALDTPQIFVVLGKRYPHCVIEDVFQWHIMRGTYTELDGNREEVHIAMEAVHSKRNMRMLNNEQPPVNGKLCTYR